MSARCDGCVDYQQSDNRTIRMTLVDLFPRSIDLYVGFNVTRKDCLAKNYSQVI